MDPGEGSNGIAPPIPRGGGAVGCHWGVAGPLPPWGLPPPPPFGRSRGAGAHLLPLGPGRQRQRGGGSPKPGRPNGPPHPPPSPPPPRVFLPYDDPIVREEQLHRVPPAVPLPPEHGTPDGDHQCQQHGAQLPPRGGDGGWWPHVPHRQPGGQHQPGVCLRHPPAGPGPGDLVPRVPLPKLRPSRGGGGGRQGAQTHLQPPDAQRHRPLLLPGGSRPQRRPVLRHLPAGARAQGRPLPQHQGGHQEPHHHGRGGPAAALRRGARPPPPLQEAMGQRAAAADEEGLGGGEPLRGAEPGRVLHVRGHLPGAAAHLPGRGQPPPRRPPAGEALRGPGGKGRVPLDPHPLSPPDTLCPARLCFVKRSLGPPCPNKANETADGALPLPPPRCNASIN